MHNKSYAAEIAHNVSSRNRTLILERYVTSFDKSLSPGEHNSLSKGQGPWRQSDEPCCTSAVRRVVCYRVFSCHMYPFHMLEVAKPEYAPIKSIMHYHFRMSCPKSFEFERTHTNFPNAVNSPTFLPQTCTFAVATGEHE